MKKRSTLIIIIAVLVIAVAAYYWLGSGTSTQNTQPEGTTPENQMPAGGESTDTNSMATGTASVNDALNP